MASGFLTIVEGLAVGAHVALDRPFVVGRDETGLGQLGPDPQISRTHARVYPIDSGECVVEDLGSTNGTLVNGRRITAPVVLSSGDLIAVGQSVLRYEAAPVNPSSTVMIQRPAFGPPGQLSTPGPAPAPAATRSSAAPMLAALLLVAAGVSVALGVYGKEHTPAGRPIFKLGFSGMLQFKTWLGTIALALIVVQILTALWMWGRLPGAGSAPKWITPLHRWSGSVAFVVSLPVAFHCLWALGFMTTSTRVVVHSVAGCAFYGAYAAKMLGLRLRNLPGWTLPVLGGTVFSAFVVAWLSAALWFFTRTGIPLT